MPGTTFTTDIDQSIRDVYSREILYEAQPKMRFAQFAKERRDLTAQPGETVRFTKFNSIDRGGKLDEGKPLDEKKMSDTEVSLTVTEYGNAISVSEKAIQTSLHDVLTEGAKLLGNDMATVLDSELRDTALSTTNIVFPNDHDATTYNTGDTFDPETIRAAVETLSTNNTPRFDGEYFICIAHPHQLRQLRGETDWIQAHQYNNTTEIYRGEVGMYEGVRFIETTQMPYYTGGDAQTKFGLTNAVETWQAVMFGENAYGWAIALDVELRSNGVKDYGRKHGLAWYSIWGFGLIEENNILQILTTD